LFVFFCVCLCLVGLVGSGGMVGGVCCVGVEKSGVSVGWEW
jgi:hypothetical protein